MVYRPGTGKRVYEHRYVWESANGPIPDGFEINHIDGDKTNNIIENLELVTRQRNQQHAYHSGLMSAPRSGKLDADKVRAIRAAYAAGQSYRKLGGEFGVSPVMIGHIIRGEAWGCVS